MSSRHRWDIQVQPNPFFSGGLHIDHRHPFITVHLPLFNFALGRIPIDDFAFQYSLRKGKQHNVGTAEYAIEWEDRWRDD
jgi:hypothetical protein